MRLARTASTGFALLALARGAARADPAPPAAPASGAPAPSEVVPPRPLAALHADYPEGATGDATVTLVLIVNADGAVRSARVAGGEEPFATAAVRAAGGFRFAPATRDGAPIAAAIRAEIRFAARAALTPTPVPHPPSSLPSPRGGDGAPPATPSLSSPGPSAPLEVTVRAESTPGATSLSRAEMRLLPGAFGDPFRAIEAMPGVTPIASGVPFFYVRGAPPGNVGYFLDGVRLPLLYHLALGPSVVNPAMIDKVDLYPGGYPARYGRFAGGIVAGETREPSSAIHAEGTLRLVDVGALVEAPFADGRGSALVGGRYSYTAAILSLLQSSVDVRYWDYQARVGFALTPRDRLSVLAFGSYDYLGQKKLDPATKVTETQTLFDTTFHRVDLRYDHRFGPETKLRQAVTLGYDVTGLDQGRAARDRMLSARTEITHRLEGGALLRAGLDVALDDTAADLARDGADEGFNLQIPSRLDLAVGTWADAVIPVTARLSAVPGVRVDLYGSQGTQAIGVDPRLAWRLEVLPWLRLSSALGIASQPPSFVLPTPGVSPGLEGGLQRSTQSSLGVEADLPGDLRAGVTLFYNVLFNLTDPLGTSSILDGFSPQSRQRELGVGAGVEISIRRKLTRRIGGFLAYTLSRSERIITRPILVSLFPRPRVDFRRAHEPSTLDRTHVLNAALSCDLGRGYSAGTRLLFYSGVPRLARGPLPGLVLMVLEERRSPFFRLDVRLEKRWAIAKRGSLSLVLEVQNATLSREVVGTSCSVAACAPQEIGPVTIPSLGLEGGF